MQSAIRLFSSCWNPVRTREEEQSVLSAIDRSMAIIEFELDGTIVQANENFLRLFGYTLAEVVGRHHRMFICSQQNEPAEYDEFWSRLRRGEYQSAQYLRLGKGGRPIWIQASYNPVFDRRGQPQRVIKFATDITDRKRHEVMLQSAVAQTQSVLQKARTKDLTLRIETKGMSGDVYALCQGMNELVESVCELLIEIKSAAGRNASASGQIAANTQELMKRSLMQAESLQAATASMQQISAAVRQNASAAGTAREVSESSVGAASEGGVTVAKLADSMFRIRESSVEIARVVAIVNQIAGQTNLLALNAAMEAARAGEAGRGFAAVAAEVRLLARQSAQAASEIEAILTATALVVEDGSSLAKDASVSIGKVVEAIKNVAAHVEAIAAVSDVQSAGIDAMHATVARIDWATQENVTAAEENAAATAALCREAEEMGQRIDAYRIVR